MSHLKPEIDRIVRASEARRVRLAALSFPEKVQAVVQIQRMAAPLLRARGKQVRVWEFSTVPNERQGCTWQVGVAARVRAIRLR